MEVVNRLAVTFLDRQFWRSTGLLVLANALVVGLGLVRTPLMTWIIPKTEIGMLGVVASWFPLIQLLSMSGADSAMYHYVSKGQPAAFIVNLYYRLRWSLLSAAALLAGAAFWAWRGDPGLACLFLIAGISFPITTGMTASAGMLSAQERFKGLFWYRLGESLTDFAGFIPLALSAWWISRVITFYSANQLATALMQVGVSFWLAHQLRRQGVQPIAQSERKEMLRYGRHLTAISSIAVLQTRTDALLVGAFLPLQTMADYSIALLLYEQLKRLWVIYQSARYPPLVKMASLERRKQMVVEGAVVALGFCLVGLSVYLLSNWLVPLVLPHEYASSLPLIAWLIAAFVLNTPGFMVETYFRSEQDERRQYLLRLISAVIGVGLPALLLPLWGVTGVVIGRALASLGFSLCGGILMLVKLPQKNPGVSR